MKLSRAQLFGILGATAVASIVMAALLPTKWVPRTGLGWEFEHFSIYLVTTFALCIALKRPVFIASSLLLFSGILEWLQNFTPDRSPDLTAAFAGGSGALLGAVLFEVVMRLRRAARAYFAGRRPQPPAIETGDGARVGAR
jgi:VanZ family protein